MYIGKLQYPELKIKPDDNDTAHLDYEAAQVIKFIHSSEGSEFVTGAVLKPEMGLTHDVFSEKYAKLSPVNVTYT